jgi:hypothetical protein
MVNGNLTSALTVVVLTSDAPLDRDLAALGRAGLRSFRTDPSGANPTLITGTVDGSEALEALAHLHFVRRIEASRHLHYEDEETERT